MTQAMCEPPFEVADDRRQRGRHDGLVQRREQHAEHERADDEQDRPVAQARQRAVTVAALAGAGSAVSPAAGLDTLI